MKKQPKNIGKGETIDYTQSVHITDDIWFYPTPKGFDFVVWIKANGVRAATQFRLTHKKIKKFII